MEKGVVCDGQKCQRLEDIQSQEIQDTLPISIESAGGVDPDITVVYETASCQKCKMTERRLGKLAIAFVTRDLKDYPEKLEEFKAAGFISAPIVESPIGTWSDLKLDKIDELRKYHEERKRALGEVAVECAECNCPYMQADAEPSLA